jgi:hypothetical protein
MSGGSRGSVSGSSDDDCADLDLTWLSVLLNLSFSRRYRALIVRYCVSALMFYHMPSVPAATVLMIVNWRWQ